MADITGSIMSRDTVVATVKNGNMTVVNEKLLPLYLKHRNNVEGWLASRAIDSHRTNSRLLKKALRLRAADDASTALAVNAATVTDCYWFKPEGCDAVYEDIRFKENYFDKLALHGDPDSFGKKPSRTPELTNTGSYEKCWRLINGEWWMYKSGNDNEYFSELFICKLSQKLGLPTAHYEMHDGYIRTRNFVTGTNANFEPIASLTDDDDYGNCFDIIYAISPLLAEDYLKIIWMDTICFNMDRHVQNFGFLRDRDSGEILSMAPNYDNNIALISRGYPKRADRKEDGLITFFKEFIFHTPTAHKMLKEIALPEISEDSINACLCACPFEVDNEFIKTFIMSGYHIIKKLIHSDI